MNIPEMVEDIVDKVRRDQISASKKIARRVASKIIGYDVDPWGDVKNVDKDLVLRIKNHPEVAGKIKQTEDAIAAAVASKMSKEKIAAIATRIMDRCENNIRTTVEKAIEAKISPLIDEAIDKELKKYSDMTAIAVTAKMKELI